MENSACNMDDIIASGNIESSPRNDPNAIEPETLPVCSTSFYTNTSSCEDNLKSTIDKEIHQKEIANIPDMIAEHKSVTAASSVINENNLPNGLNEVANGNHAAISSQIEDQLFPKTYEENATRSADDFMSSEAKDDKPTIISDESTLEDEKTTQSIEDRNSDNRPTMNDAGPVKVDASSSKGYQSSLEIASSSLEITSFTTDIANLLTVDQITAMDSTDSTITDEKSNAEDISAITDEIAPGLNASKIIMRDGITEMEGTNLMKEDLNSQVDDSSSFVETVYSSMDSSSLIRDDGNSVTDDNNLAANSNPNLDGALKCLTNVDMEADNDDTQNCCEETYTSFDSRCDSILNEQNDAKVGRDSVNKTDDSIEQFTPTKGIHDSTVDVPCEETTENMPGNETDEHFLFGKVIHDTNGEVTTDEAAAANETMVVDDRDVKTTEVDNIVAAVKDAEDNEKLEKSFQSSDATDTCKPDCDEVQSGSLGSALVNRQLGILETLQSIVDEPILDVEAEASMPIEQPVPIADEKNIKDEKKDENEETGGNSPPSEGDCAVLSLIEKCHAELESLLEGSALDRGNETNIHDNSASDKSLSKPLSPLELEIENKDPVLSNICKQDSNLDATLAKDTTYTSSHDDGQGTAFSHEYSSTTLTVKCLHLLSDEDVLASSSVHQYVDSIANGKNPALVEITSLERCHESLPILNSNIADDKTDATTLSNIEDDPSTSSIIAKPDENITNIVSNDAFLDLETMSKPLLTVPSSIMEDNDLKDAEENTTAETCLLKDITKLNTDAKHFQDSEIKLHRELIGVADNKSLQPEVNIEIGSLGESIGNSFNESELEPGEIRRDKSSTIINNEICMESVSSGTTVPEKIDSSNAENVGDKGKTHLLGKECIMMPDVTSVRTITLNESDVSDGFKTPVNAVSKTVLTFKDGQFTCSACVFSSARPEFMEHLICHLLKKPFKCLHCQGLFPDHFSVTNHMTTEHPDAEIKCRLLGATNAEQLLSRVMTRGPQVLEILKKQMPLSNPLTSSVPKYVQSVLDSPILRDSSSMSALDSTSTTQNLLFSESKIDVKNVSITESEAANLSLIPIADSKPKESINTQDADFGLKIESTFSLSGMEQIPISDKNKAEDERNHSVVKDTTETSIPDASPNIDFQTKVKHESDYFYRCGQENCFFSCMNSIQFRHHLAIHHPGSQYYNCIHCGLVCYWEESLIRHMNNHVNNKAFILFICPYPPCKFGSNILSGLVNHIPKYHPTVATYPCGCCRQPFSNLQELTTHLQTNLLKFVHCPYCTAKNRNRKAIIDHIKMEHPGKAKQIIVSSQLGCQDIVAAKQKRIADSHERTQSPLANLDRTIGTITTPDTMRQENATATSYQKPFKHYKTHEISQSEVILNIKQESVENTTSNSHQQKQGKGESLLSYPYRTPECNAADSDQSRQKTAKYSCHKCEYVTNELHNFLSHQTVCTGRVQANTSKSNDYENSDSPVLSDRDPMLNPSGFQQERQALLHFEVPSDGSMTSGKRHSCPLCRTTCPTLSRLRKHILRVHVLKQNHEYVDLTVYRCLYCGSLEISKEMMLDHLRERHPGKPVKIARRHDRVSAVQQPARKRSTNFSGLQPGESFEVGEQLMGSGIPTASMLLIDQYHCDSCNFSTNTKESLLDHITVHTSERKFQINVHQSPRKQAEPSPMKTPSFSSSKLDSPTPTPSDKSHSMTKNIPELYRLGSQDLDNELSVGYTSLFGNISRGLQCKLCKVTFDSKYKIHRHLLGKHLHIFLFKCNYCELQSLEFCTIPRHSKTAHKRKPVRVIRKMLPDLHDVMQKCVRDHDTKQLQKLPFHNELQIDDNEDLEDNENSFSEETMDDSPAIDDSQLTAVTHKNLFNDSVELSQITVGLDKSKITVYTCKYCPHKCSTAYNMKKHIRSHFLYKPFGCGICGYKGQYEYVIKDHSSNKHPDLLPQVRQMTVPDILQFNRHDRRLYANIEDIPTTSESARSIWNPECSMEDRGNGSKSKAHKHASVEPACHYMYQCSGCSYSSNTSANVQEHQSTCTQVWQLKCGYCKFKCAGKADMLKHLNLWHKRLSRKYQVSQNFKIRRFAVPDQQQSSSSSVDTNSLNQAIRSSIETNQSQAIIMSETGKPMKNMFKCCKCGYVSLRMKSLYGHLKSCGPFKFYKCGYCIFTCSYKKREEILEHLCQIHKGKKIKYNKIDSLSSRVASVLMPLNTPDGKPVEAKTYPPKQMKSIETYSALPIEQATTSTSKMVDMFQCGRCGYQAEKLRSVHGHLKTCGPLVVLKCHYCKFTTKNKADMLRHLCAWHKSLRERYTKVENPGSRVLRIKVPMSEVTPSNRVYQISGPTEVENSNSSISNDSEGVKVKEEPKDTENADQLNMEPETITPKSLIKKHPQQIIEGSDGTRYQEIFKCTKCGYSSPHKKSVCGHLKSCGPLFYFTCNMCTFKCRQKSDIIVHLSISHGTLAEMYEKVVSTTTQIKRTLVPITEDGEVVPGGGKEIETVESSAKKRKHEGNDKGPEPSKTFVCQQCNYESSQKMVMLSHVLKHLDYKPYVCGYCDSRHVDFAHIKKHCVLAHPDKEASFSLEKNDLLETEAEKMLELSATNVNEDTSCMQQFKVRGNTDGRVHQCPKCTYRSPNKENFNRHIQYHESRFRCGYCQYNAPYSYLCKRHCEKTHPDKPQKVVGIKAMFNDVAGFGGRDLPTKASRQNSEDEPHVSAAPKVKDPSNFSKSPYFIRITDPDGFSVAFQCRQCSFLTDNRMLMKKHSIKHQPVLYKCGYCSYTNYPKSMVAKHARRVHRNRAVRYVEIKQDPDDITEGGPKVGAASVSYSKKKNGKRLLSGPRDPTNRLPTIPEKIAKEETETTPPPLSYCCHNCQYFSTKLSAFQEHLQIHEQHSSRESTPCENEKKSCGYCSFEATDVVEFESHIASHIWERPYGCAYCEFTGFDKSSIFKHCRRKHPNNDLAITNRASGQVTLKSKAIHFEPKVALKNVLLMNQDDFASYVQSHGISAVDLSNLHIPDKFSDSDMDAEDEDSDESDIKSPDSDSPPKLENVFDIFENFRSDTTNSNGDVTSPPNLSDVTSIMKAYDNCDFTYRSSTIMDETDDIKMSEDHQTEDVEMNENPNVSVNSDDGSNLETTSSDTLPAPVETEESNVAAAGEVHHATDEEHLGSEICDSGSTNVLLEPILEDTGKELLPE